MLIFILFYFLKSVWPICFCPLWFFWNHLLSAWLEQLGQVWENGRIWRDHQALHVLMEVLFQTSEKKFGLTDGRPERPALELMAELPQFSRVLSLRYVLSKVVSIHMGCWFCILDAFFSICHRQSGLMVSYWGFSITKSWVSSKILCFNSSRCLKQLWRFPEVLQCYTVRLSESPCACVYLLVFSTFC